MGRQPHIVVVPFPAQGHVKPLMQLSHKLVDQGIKITFATAEFIHEKITAGMTKKEIEESRITLASIPDGLETEKDRIDPEKFPKTMRRFMSVNLKSLIEDMNESNNDDPVTCVIADVTMGWILEVVKSIGLEGIAFCPMSAANIVLLSKIPELIQEGIIDRYGTTMKKEKISFSKNIPAWSSDELTWSFPINTDLQKVSFDFCNTKKEAIENATWLLCNTSYELDQSACDLIPKILPIGPLHANLETERSATTGNFWQEDTSVINWLNKQKPASVIYVSFGSIAVVSQSQFNEIALGLQTFGNPFLWIVRSDIIYGSAPDYPHGFFENVGDIGKIVEWAPQNKVLSHPSIACFVSHCGWNSTLEGLSAGVPFLCWPVFADQFHNGSFICDAWNVGLKLNPDKTGIISCAEISMKIGELLSYGHIKENAAKMKTLLQKSCTKEGSSSLNLEKFIHHLKHRP